MDSMQQLIDLLKASEAGNYDAKPSSLVQGAALQKEDLSPKMEYACWNDKSIVLQKMIDTKPAKSNTWQWNRQLSYGDFDGSAQMEGHVGPENTSDIARAVVPMAYYVDHRRVTEVSKLVDTFDGKTSDERAAEDAAKKIAGDVEFAMFRGGDDFSNAGVYDGNPFSIPDIMPGMHGAFLQVRQADAQRTATDLMLAEFGAAETVVFTVGGTLTQGTVEDIRARTTMNNGDAEKLVLDPITRRDYNKLSQGKERIILAGSPQEATGARLEKQWTANGDVEVVSCRFLAGKTGPQRQRSSTPPPSAGITPTSTTTGGLVTPFQINQVYQYYVTAKNENGGESAKASNSVTIAASGDEVVLVIQAPASGTYRSFVVYRSLAGGSLASAKFIGRVKAAASGNTTFRDQGNKLPGSVTGMLMQADSFEARELAGFTRKRLAEVDLATPEAFYRFLCIAAKLPRFNVILDNLVGQ